MLKHTLLAALLCLAAALPGQAQTDETPAAILVLDGSGSMWGQIDGVNKIVIARHVIGEMLADLPNSQALGLTVYGHRTRGDCSDIETVIAPGLDTRAAIAEAVNAVNPRGRTPMTDAVVEAARALRHTENAATVILVSDGIETCEADPCAIAAELEAAGIAFTAHVIGFDVASEPEARAQMQCIADNTGGQFLTADNAEELAAALEQVAVAPAPQPVEITFQAVVEPDMAPPTSPLTWEVFDADGTPVLAATQAPGLRAPLLPGTYRAQVLRMTTGTEHGASFTVEDGMPQTVTVALPFLPPPTHEVTFTARIGDPDGPIITDPVLWELMPLPENLQSVEEGNGLIFDMTDGSYDLAATWTVQEVTIERQFVVSGAAREIVVVFEAPQLQASLTAPAEAVAGATIEVGWAGPDLDNDYIGIGRADGRGSGWINYAYTRDGTPSALMMPPEPGDYVIQYFLGDGREAIASAAITVTPVTASITAPATGPAGGTVEIAWTGPDYDNDFVGVGPADADGSDRWMNYVYTRDGSPTTIQLPPEPGEYVLTYFLAQDRTPVAQTPIRLTEVQATLTAPAEAVAGDTIEIGWTGPDYDNDYIGIGPVGASGAAQWQNYTYTRDGNPMQLEVPTEPGTYQITYFLNQDRVALASVDITVTESQGSITAPATAIAGSTIEIGWTGPDYDNDYIGVGAVGATGGAQWENYTYTRDGNPMRLEMPTDAGAYEITYFLGQDRARLVTVPIEVTPLSARLNAPGTAVAGSTIDIGWEGPDYNNDYIGIGATGASGGGLWQNYSYTRDGNPAALLVPPEPGDYVISYFLGQDRAIAASTTVTVTPVTAQLIAPGKAQAGTEIEIAWDGPDYNGDYIGIGRPDATGGGQWETYTYTREGSPMRIAVPDEAGPYVLRYFLGQDRVVIATAPLIVE